MVLKFGRKPAVHTRRTMRLAIATARALDELGTPPAVSTVWSRAVAQQVGGGNWGMMGNDEWGDCVEAADGHDLMVRSANVGKVVIPTTDQIVALYSAETGFNPKDGPPGSNPTDQGTDETSDCRFMTSTGILGHKADATGPIDPSNIDHVRWAVELFGACRLGVNVPQSAMDQFNAGQPWTVVANDGGIVGGHGISIIEYDPDWYYVVTWGRTQKLDAAWLAKYCDEAHVMLFADWFNAAGKAPPGFDLQALLADLKTIEASAAPAA
jgi:hypothetical protein